MLQFCIEPIRYFERRLSAPPSWVRALAPMLLCTLLQLWGASLFTSDFYRQVNDMLGCLGVPSVNTQSLSLVSALMSAAAMPIAYVLLSAAVVSIDILAHDLHRNSRIFECVGHVFYTQVPYCLLLLVLFYCSQLSPIPMPPDSRPDTIRAVVFDYKRELYSSSPMILAETVRYLSQIWLIVIVSAILRAVTRLSWQTIAVVVAVLVLVYALSQRI